MSGKIIFEMESPKTQTVEAVENLAIYLNKHIEGGVLDLGTVKLVLSNKKDVFYTVSARSCSCPSHTYRGGPCKHQRKYFPQPVAEIATNEPLIQRGGFKPFAEA